MSAGAIGDVAGSGETGDTVYAKSVRRYRTNRMYAGNFAERSRLPEKMLARRTFAAFRLLSDPHNICHYVMGT